MPDWTKSPRGNKVKPMNISAFFRRPLRFQLVQHPIITLVILVNLPALAQFPGLPGCSPEFYREVMAAEHMVNETKSAEPLLALLRRSSNPAEQASLEMSIGLDYNQRTGVVNPSNAVVHFTAALKYDALPEKNLMEILLWRGGSLEQLAKPTEALKDYLRGLLECSYYDLAGGWPEILSPAVAIFMNSPDPENAQRAQDYNRYRRHVDFGQFLVQQRYYFIESAKRVRQGKSDQDILEILRTLSPDSVRNEKIVASLKSENKCPWP